MSVTVHITAIIKTYNNTIINLQDTQRCLELVSDPFALFVAQKAENEKFLVIGVVIFYGFFLVLLVE